MNWTPPTKPAELTEHRLITAILSGQFPINSNLPAERELAAQLGITRPTLREVLQRLARDGWLEIHHGKPTRVCNYLEEGNLAVLAAMAAYQEDIPPDFIDGALFVRILLAPAYARLAVARAPARLVATRAEYPALEDTPQAYTDFDWEVHHQLAIISANPFFTLFVNSFHRLYDLIGPLYFQHAAARQHSKGFYEELLACARRRDPAAAEELVRRIMVESRQLWTKAGG